MTASSITVPISMPSALAGVTLRVRVTGVRIARLRIWLGTRLMVAAAFVMGCGIEIETAGGGTRHP